MNRRNFIGVRLFLSSAAATVCISGATARAQAPAGPGSLSGVWFNSDFAPANMFDPALQVVRTAEGKPPPLQPWAAALVAKRVEAGRRGETFVTTLSQCLPNGMPGMMFYPANPFQILESPGQVTILIEQLTLFRVIRMNAAHEKNPVPSFFGDSVGRWDGDTLVVDTVGLTDKTTIDQAGTPHSKDLHIVERYRRTGPNVIEVVISMDDPKVFTSAWTTVRHLRLEPPDREIEEWYCENQRNPAGATGARIVSPAADR